jgi:branched-subunit amino acid ABC-type transport system permease component
VLDLLLDIVTTAAILFVVAAGLLIVFGVLKIINFAHGGFLTIGGYAALIVTQLGLSPYFAAPFALLVGLVLGAAVEVLIVRPLYSRPLDAILATWGLSIVVVQLITLVFGRGTNFVQSPVQGAVAVLDTSYSLYRLLMLAIAARPAPMLSIDPLMGVPWLLNAFMLVMVSGTSLGSLAVACLLLGGAQVVVSTYSSPVLGALTIVVLAAVMLRLRPAGFARG